jgi:hypothetical protein
VGDLALLDLRVGVIAHDQLPGLVPGSIHDTGVEAAAVSRVHRPLRS